MVMEKGLNVAQMMRCFHMDCKNRVVFGCSTTRCVYPELKNVGSHRCICCVKDACPDRVRRRIGSEIAPETRCELMAILAEIDAVAHKGDTDGRLRAQVDRLTRLLEVDF